MTGLSFGRTGLRSLALDKIGTPLPVAPLQLIGTKYGPGAGGEGDGLVGDAGHAAATSRLRHDMPAYGAWLEEIHYPGFYFPPTTAGETANPATINVKAAFEPEGATQITVAPASGNRPEALAGGVTALVVKPAARIDIAPSSKPYSRQRVTVVAGQQWPTNRIAHGSINSAGESENTFGTGAGADAVDATGTFTGTTPAYAFSPLALLGRPKDGKRRPAIMIFDDSTGSVSGVDSSSGDGNYGDANGYAGKWERGIGSSIATMNVARASAQLRGYAASNDRIMEYVKYVSDVILPPFFNDWSAGRTATQILADYDTIIAKFKASASSRGVRLWLQTSWPKPATTSNSWVDGGATLISSGVPDGHRRTVNAAIRAGSIAGVAGYFDFGLALEDAGREGYYRTDLGGPVTPDGSHMTAIGQAAAVAVVTAGLGRFTL